LEPKGSSNADREHAPVELIKVRLLSAVTLYSKAIILFYLYFMNYTYIEQKRVPRIYNYYNTPKKWYEEKLYGPGHNCSIDPKKTFSVKNVYNITTNIGIGVPITPYNYTMCIYSPSHTLESYSLLNYQALDMDGKRMACKSSVLYPNDQRIITLWYQNNDLSWTQLDCSGTWGNSAKFASKTLDLETEICGSSFWLVNDKENRPLNDLSWLQQRCIIF
jgi:hypothetical protein